MAVNPMEPFLLEQMMQLEVTMAEVLTAECERGQMTEDQLEFILDLFANLDQYEDAELQAQFDAWCLWRDETNPGWRGS